MRLKEFIPPLVGDLVRRRRLGGGRPFASYDAAVKACGSEYEHNTTIGVVLAKTKHFRDTVLATRPLVADDVALRNFLSFSLATSGGELNVLDFGGASGLHYYYARAWLGDDVVVRWHVIETPKMVAAARELENDSLKFYTSIVEARTALPDVGLLFSSSVMQCLPDPCRTLAELTAVGARYVVLTRIGLTRTSQPRYTLQTAKFSGTGPGPLPPGMKDGDVRYPLTFAPKADLERVLSERYSIELEFVEKPKAHVVGNEWIDMYGYLARRKSQQPS